MGQAAVDLPDPLNPPAESAASTDDLLAKLAGEEIDRMLAESESVIAPAPPQPAPAPSLLPAESAAATPASEPDIDAAAELQTILGQAQTDPAEDPVAAVAALGQPRGPANPAVDAPLDEDELAAAERGALHDEEGDSAIAEVQSEPGSGTWLVKLLGWLNAPFESCSDEVRDTLGKIAILTAVNAIAVMAYVLLIRRHG